MNNLLEDYEQQYAILVAEVTAHIGKLRLLPNSDKNDLYNKIHSNLDEAHELLEQMGLEVRETDHNIRPSLTNRLNCYQAELKRLEQEFKNTKNMRTNGYESTDEYSELGIRDDQKQRLLENSERIERTGKQLQDGYKIVVETNEIGAQVLQDLSTQRETIQRSRHRIRETDAELGRSSRILNSMIMRSIRERAILYIVGLVFIIVVIVSIYLSFRK